MKQNKTRIPILCSNWTVIDDPREVMMRQGTKTLLASLLKYLIITAGKIGSLEGNFARHTPTVDIRNIFIIAANALSIIDIIAPNDASMVTFGSLGFVGQRDGVCSLPIQSCQLRHVSPEKKTIQKRVGLKNFCLATWIWQKGNPRWPREKLHCDCHQVLFSF